MGKKSLGFLDSNVILSGLLSEGAPHHARPAKPRTSVSYGCDRRYNLIEIERNLKKKMPDLLFLYKAYLFKLNLQVIPLPRPEEVRDFSGQIAEKDIPVLISAIRSKVDFLVTDDKQHFGKMKEIGKYPFHVVTPSEFLDSILPEILKGLEEKE
jgi:predicted nucleic acid-binding protein